MPNQDASPSTLHERTVTALNQLVQEALAHVSGLDRMIVNQAIPMIYPRIQRRIASASEEALHEQLLHMKNMIESVLQETKGTSKKSGSKRKPRQKTAAGMKRSASKKSKQ
ncbi:hypothetical protein [Alicyclobacillus dauci]|uniref:Uncharacterized protein n=1 Tax=Alicyclobacillus dauci TaxID=1475485 RepID=A0ABY6Z0K6_9BACL|nr:hypothetical protein [Alicyclobacillus dauci]WAH36118.1 hypothetical protein NZD86_17985 [Alicyclobacillus dauci]